MKIPVYGSLLIPCILLSLSCKKKKETVTECPNPTPLITPITYDNYSMLKTGNYWIYERYQVEENGTATNLKQNDSTYIEKDTTIRGQKYFKLIKKDFLRNKKSLSFLRDSLHYIINELGNVLFSNEDFTNVFNTQFIVNTPDPQTNDTICKITSKMDDKDVFVNLPIGRFKTSAMKSTFYFYPNWVQGGRVLRYKNNRFTKNVGLVSETEDFFLSLSYVIERRLIRYHLN